MNTTITIGLCGPAGCGKDTVRAILEQRHDFAGLAFADPMRAMLAALLDATGCSNEYMTRRDLKEAAIPGLGLSYRRLAQTLGTEWGRLCLGENFWLRAAENEAERLRLQGWQRIVYSDVRFANEAAHIRQQGGLIWHVHRPATAPVAAHVSEEMPFLADRVVFNGGSREDLHQAVADALTCIPGDLAHRVSTYHALGQIVPATDWSAA